MARVVVLLFVTLAVLDTLVTGDDFLNQRRRTVARGYRASRSEKKEWWDMTKCLAVFGPVAQAVTDIDMYKQDYLKNYDLNETDDAFIDRRCSEVSVYLRDVYDQKVAEKECIYIPRPGDTSKHTQRQVENSRIMREQTRWSPGYLAFVCSAKGRDVLKRMRDSDCTGTWEAKIVDAQYDVCGWEDLRDKTTTCAKQAQIDSCTKGHARTLCGDAYGEYYDATNTAKAAAIGYYVRRDCH